jgi:hypothetical protein
MAEEERKIRTDKHKKWCAEHREEMRRRGIRSVEKQSKCKINEIERAMWAELEKSGLKFKYNKILHMRFQYDFIINDNILLEVQGDYWHANPEIYNRNGDDQTKKKLYPYNLDII